ncbi:MAG TPA: hypothetical protein VHM24_08090, partial [Gemmatimonadaceae bacterium]|nr:hypothetical protein [Gemmatimonadaceae bacterium]
KKVDIEVMCSLTPDSIFVKVDPWTVQLSRNTPKVIWKLTNSSNATDIDIKAKTDTSPWPFADRPPYSGQPKEKESKGAIVGTKDQLYAYTIVATCPAGGGGTRKVVIDPDMIIID